MANSNIVQVIQKICQQERAASNPADFYTGEVVSTDPWEVSIYGGLTIPEDFLVITQTALDRDLVEGDTVAVLRADGGQRFLLLDKAEVMDDESAES